MGFFPLFVDLSGRPVLLVGGGLVAERKLKTLLCFGASVSLVSPQITAEIQRQADAGLFCCRQRAYRPQDMESVGLAVAASDDREVNRRVSQDARRAGIPVNVVDDPALCTFYFPAVVQRGDLTVGISTAGSYPAFAAYARRKIETMFPDNCGEMLAALKEERQRILREVPDPAERRAALESLLETALGSEESGGADRNGE